MESPASLGPSGGQRCAMGERWRVSAGLLPWLVQGLLVVPLVLVAGCAMRAGDEPVRPHAGRETAGPKLESRPPMVARDEVPRDAVARDEVAITAPDDEDRAGDEVEEVVVTGTRLTTEPAVEPATAASDELPDARAGLLTEVDRILAALPMGSAAFGVPPRMKVGERTTARLRLSSGESAATLADEIRRLSPDVAAVLSDPVRVHTVMLARLDGTAGLEIRLLGGQEERTLATAGTEEWVWEVTAVQPGAESVHLELFAVIEVQGEQRKNLRRSWDAVVAVAVPPPAPTSSPSIGSGLLAWAGKNFQWLWAAILVPLGGLAYRTYQARRRKTPPPGFTEIKKVPEVTDHAD